MKKKSSITTIIIATIVAVSLMLAPEISHATDNEEPPVDIYTPEYQHISDLNVGLVISTGTATATTKIFDNQNKATKIVCTMCLQKYSNGSWSNVAVWTSSNSGGYMFFQKTRSVTKGKYRVKSNAISYNGKTSETITKYSGTVTY